MFEITTMEELEAIADTVEPLMVGDLSHFDVVFLMAMLDVLLKGKPEVAHDPKTGCWVVIPSCECEECKPFKDQYVPTECKTLVRALRRYAEDLAVFEDALEQAEKQTKH